MVLELAASISVLLLAFGLIASMANVLTKGSALTDHHWMQQIWARAQCIAIDASVAGTIIWAFRYRAEGERVKAWLYGILSVLLLFTATIVSNIAAIQQTLNLTLANAYIHVFVPVELLIWIRSIAIVLLIVAHAMRHIQIDEPVTFIETAPSIPISPEMMQQLHLLLQQTAVIEEQPGTPQLTQIATTPEEQETPLNTLFPSVSEEERNKVIEAFKKGIPRREICSYLRWGNGKYTTIVKPVLDAYEQQEQQTGTA